MTCTVQETFMVLIENNCKLVIPGDFTENILTVDYEHVQSTCMKLKIGCYLCFRTKPVFKHLKVMPRTSPVLGFTLSCP